MVAIGQTYRPEGHSDPRALLIAAILGATSAALAAAVAYSMQNINSLKATVVLTAGQGMVIGAVLALVVGRLRLRGPKVIAVIAVGSTLGSIALLHHALYLNLLDDFAAHFDDIVATLPDATPEQRAAVLAAGPRSLFDDYLRSEYGHAGAIGGLCHRAVSNRHAIAYGVTLYAIGAVLAVGFAAGFPVARSLLPFCEDCDEWCVATRLPLTMRCESAPALGGALRRDDLAEAGDALRAVANPTCLQHHYGKITLHRCPTCDLTFADVQQFEVTRRTKAQTKVRDWWVVRQVRISPIMTELILAPGDGPDADAPEALGTRGEAVPTA